MKILIDTAKKYTASLGVALTIGFLSTIWGVFVRPQLVMASDLQAAVGGVEVKVEAIAGTVVELKYAVDANTENIETILLMQIHQQIYYVEDRIRTLEITGLERDLTPVEAQRLLYYRDELNSLKSRLP